MVGPFCNLHFGLDLLLPFAKLLLHLQIRGDATIRQAMGPPSLHREGKALVSTGGDSRAVYLLESGWVARPA